ncbi:hypothetical protein D1816_03145 [Aquimarina sp. AD10]|nr:hypothetical protein D1816_03145 [Aquimarina sp. AD10]
MLNNACAQENLNPLTELPLQIKLGKTTYSEIKDKGDCFRKKMINQNDYICKTMSVDMDNERYTLSLDDDQRVNTLYFSDENNMTKASILPKNWKNLGLFLRKGASGRGTSKKDFIAIIKSLGIKDFIEKCEKEDCKFIYVRFKLDNVYYSAIFRQYSTWGFESGLKSFYISTVSY